MPREDFLQDKDGFYLQDKNGYYLLDSYTKVQPVQNLPPIRIYESTEKLFTSNGLRCLFPQTAEVTLKEQQAHTIRLVHPLDDEGAWKTIRMSRILYVPIMYRNSITFQPMRIYKIQKQRQNGGTLSITVDAKHVFYDLNSVMVQACTVSAPACQAAIAAVFSNIYHPTVNPQASDNFSYSSDIEGTATAEYSYQTVTAALVGNENSIASIYGGELYADGFRFSINSRMEGAKDNAFHIAYNYNLEGITATYSTESTYSAVVGESNITTAAQVRTVDPSTLELPFDRTIYAKFSYQAGTPAEKFTADMDNYSAASAKVSASYQVTFADLPRSDAYEGFANLETYEVGDTGIVYDEDLDVNTVQKIVEKKLDVLTQTAISATLGSTPDSITQSKAYANTVTNTLTADEKAQTVVVADISEELAAMLMPKATAAGAPPLMVSTHLTAPIEAWAVYGAAGGVGVTRSGDIKIAVSVNSEELAAVTVPQKLYAGDYIRRAEGGAAIVHLEHDSGGTPLPDPVEQAVTMPVLMMIKGPNVVTVAGTVQPESIEIVYR